MSGPFIYSGGGSGGGGGSGLDEAQVRAIIEDVILGSNSGYDLLTTAAGQALIDAAVAAIVDSSPAALDTLNELAAALGDDANFATTVLNALAGKSNVGHTHVGADITDLMETVSPRSLKAAGAVGDGVLGITGVATATDATFTDVSANWVSADIGKAIAIQDAGTAGATLVTTIASINSPTSIELSAAAVTSVASNAYYVYGTDDTAAVQSVLDDLVEPGQIAIAEDGAIYCIAGNLQTKSIVPITNDPTGIVCLGGLAYFIAIGAGSSSDYLVAPERWVTGTALAFSSTPMHFENIAFDAFKLRNTSLVIKGWRTRAFDCLFTGALVDDCVLTRQNQDGSNGTAGTDYLSNCGFWRCLFDSRGTGTGLRSQGRAADNKDAPTDCDLNACTFAGNNTTPYGFHLGNAGGWLIEGVHTYESTTRDFYIERLADIGYLDGVFEDLCTIEEITGDTRPILLAGSCSFWEGLEVLFANDTSAEVLVINGLEITTGRSGTNGQLTVTTTQAAKTIILNQPVFRATTPIVRTTAGRIEVFGGRDGNGAMGIQIWEDGVNGFVDRSLQISASPAANDIPYRVERRGKDSSGNTIVYASLETQILDPTAGSPDGAWRFYACVAGVDTLILTLGPAVVSTKTITSQVAGGAQVGLNAFGEGTTTNELRRYSGDALGPVISGYKARGTIASPASVSQFDELFRISAGGYSSSAFRDSALIRHYVFAATPSSSDMEGQWRFEACAAASATVTEIMRLSHANGLAMFGANTVVDASRHLRLRAYTVGTLPSASPAGQCAKVTDAAASPVFNATPTGGGSLHVGVQSDGSNWRYG